MKQFKEDLFTYCIENGILQDYLDASEPYNDNTNVGNALQEPFVVKQDPGKNSSQSPPHINHHCCYECGDPLNGIFCHQCTCEFCGKGAHYGYNCPPNVSIIPNPEPCNNQTIDELPQTLPSFDLTCYSGDESLFTCDSTPNIVDDSPNVFSPPLQPLTYSMSFVGTMLIMVTIVHFKFRLPLIRNLTPSLSTKELDNSLSMGDEHLDTISTMESDEFIKSSNLISIPSPRDFSESNNEVSSIDDDSFSNNIDYVEASPPDSELVSSEVMEIVIPEVEEIEDDNMREKLLNVHLLIASFNC
nr:hypothetical protein [Tanacetum cinerariifolium]